MTTARATCFHCGDALPRTGVHYVQVDGAQRPVCCPGCEAVATLIADAGLADFYRHRTGPAPTPPEPAVDEWNAFDRDAMLITGMNGEPLPAAHGFPLRMLVPGLYGYVSATKWLTELELTTFEAFDQYWVERDWEPQAPIKTMSRVDTPRGLSQVEAGTTVPIAGVAWAQTRGIDKVEVSIDGGDWVEAELAPAFNDVTWRQWVHRWDTTGLQSGRHELRCRATDSTGETQTEQRQAPFPDGATGWHSVVVMVA